MTAVIWATVDKSAGVALITGRNHDEYVRQIAPQSRWSRSGKGWVITLAQLRDLACLCTEERVIYRERAR